MTKIILPDGYKPTVTEEYMNPMHLEYFRQKLLNWKQELFMNFCNVTKYFKTENLNEIDLSDCAIIETEVNFEFSEQNRYKGLIDKIDEALMLIDNGEYGYCEETGDEIRLARLEARPIATLCIEAQESYENYKKQHLDFDKNYTVS